MNNLPKFDAINPSTIAQELTARLADNKKTIEQLTAQKKITWKNFIEPLEKLDVELNEFWSPISHLNSVKNNPELREAYQACLPKLSNYFTALGQHKGLYNAFKTLKESVDFKHYTPTQQKLITDELRDFHLAGVDLPADKQKNFRDLSEQLTQLTNQFEENVLDATNAWFYTTTDKTELVGIPEVILDIAASHAKAQKEKGWRLTLDFPCYAAVMSHAKNRALREKLYTAYATRASDQGSNAGKWDNSQIMEDIVNKRYELAKLLGFSSYADYSLATKMADSPQQIIEFLNGLVKRCQAVAQQELTELRNFAKQTDGTEELAAWDIGYYSELLQQKTLHLSQEQLRPYLPLNKVLPGLFSVAKRLYDIDFEAETQVNSWHEHVQIFKVIDNQQSVRGRLYIDLYARKNKRGGAWVDEGRNYYHFTDKDSQTPVTFLTCNFAPPTNGQPALLTHDDVVTLFHEFGHALHHLLTKVPYPSLAGFNGVPWDAVEFPSQFMENWCWQKDVIALISQHYKTGEVLPDNLFSQLLKVKNFHSGLFLLRQLEFALFDLNLHLQNKPSKTPRVQSTLDQVRKSVSVIPVPSFNRFQHGFSHIFAGGYAAGYYSYLWAEVLACDAFDKFAENDIFSQTLGTSFMQNVLEKGGSANPMELFIAFRGRKPDSNALLKSYGLIEK